MDARAFASGPRTAYRQVRWTGSDLLVGAGGIIALAIVILR
jgi:energy-coupling factor transporter transmembrane protein EcfT